tara:strand:- start:2144 stop:2398 length:255 start_codon:yes stop_codon:yes gene_type:complete
MKKSIIKKILLVILCSASTIVLSNEDNLRYIVQTIDAQSEGAFHGYIIFDTSNGTHQICTPFFLKGDPIIKCSEWTKRNEDSSN